MSRTDGEFESRRTAGLGRRPAAVVAAVLLLGWMGLAITANAQSMAEQWHRWEKELRTTRDYHQVLVNGVLQKDNPYRKLTLRVTYSPVSCAVPTAPWCQSFTGYGFWDGGRVFKIRGSFPAGTWNYSVSCSGTSGGTSTAPLTCSDDPVLNQSGTITVNNSNPAESDLFERGFVRRSTNSGLKYLTYGDGQAPFFWRADTAWAAASVPNINNSTNSTRWANFLSDRKAKSFTAIMMGVVPDGEDANNARNVLWDDVSQSDAPCDPNATAWPQLCSRWRPEFWRKFEEMIRSTNEAGFLVVIIGVMDPQGNPPPPGTPHYPTAAAASVFARNLTARLAGDHVIFSPSFDDGLSAATRTLMDAVGNALRDAAPRHLLTAHLAGGSNICDYYDMHNTAKHPWHQIHIFQSGHALNTSNCLSGETRYQCAVRRARDIPDLLSPTPTNPPACTDPAPNSTTVKPNANGEAAYDNTYTLAPAGTVDSPYGVRHTGYDSALNGAFGVTLGVNGTWNWGATSPTNLATDGSAHMGILGNQFELNPWQMLQRRSLRIKNQPAGEEQKMTMAVTSDNNLAMIYMPNNDEIRFDGTFLSGFDCTNATWTVAWVNPRTGQIPSTQGTCQNISNDPSGATRLLRRPSCQPAANGVLGECDWVVRLWRSGFYGPPPVPQSSSLEVWPAPADDGSGWRVLGRSKTPAGGQGGREPFPVTEPTVGPRLKLPVTAQDAEGSFVVVWESENDGDLHGIFLRRVDGQGRLLDREYPVNVTVQYDQTNPAVALDPAGRGGVVTWTSYAQDGDSGGIFARLLNPAGVPFGKEIPVNQFTAGRQDFSKVAFDTQGHIFVAWTRELQDGDQEGVFARRFDERGDPLGPEFRVNTTIEGAQWLTNVEPESQGNVLVTWTSYAPDGRELGLFGQRYGADGSPAGGEFLVVPPPAAEPQ